MTKTSRTVGYSLLASAFVGGLLVGVVFAAHPGGTHHTPKGRTNAGEWNTYKFGTSPKDLMVIFAVDIEGNVEANYRKFGTSQGVVADWEFIQNPSADLNIDIRIGNPKTCWTTSTGDKQCVNY